MFLNSIDFHCWSIQHMFPESRLVHEELNAFHGFADKEMCVIIVAKVVWIGETIVTHFA
jgi:hypothetical protein